METSRKKALELMQQGIVAYKLLNLGWDISDHFGDGFDLVAEKSGKYKKIELKAIDLTAIQKGKNATQHLSANEMVNSTHLIITIFDNIDLKTNYIMSIQQFVENSGVKKYAKYSNYDSFITDYRRLVIEKSLQRKGSVFIYSRLDFDFSFNPNRQQEWKLAEFENKWENLK